MALLAKDSGGRPADAEVARRILAAVALAPGNPPREAGMPQAPYGARAGDTALLDATLLDAALLDAPPPGVAAGRGAGASPERRTLIRLGAAVAGLAAVTIGVAALSGGGEQAESAVAAQSPAAAGASPTPEGKGSAAPTPRPSRTPSLRPSPNPEAVSHAVRAPRLPQLSGVAGRLRPRRAGAGAPGRYRPEAGPRRPRGDQEDGQGHVQGHAQGPG